MPTSKCLWAAPGVADDIAGPALFLASDLSSYITGLCLYVGGGMGYVYAYGQSSIATRASVAPTCKGRGKPPSNQPLPQAGMRVPHPGCAARGDRADLRRGA